MATSLQLIQVAGKLTKELDASLKQSQDCLNRIGQRLEEVSNDDVFLLILDDVRLKPLSPRIYQRHIKQCVNKVAIRNYLDVP